jgi:hypothetical protein
MTGNFYHLYRRSFFCLAFRTVQDYPEEDYCEDGGNNAFGMWLTNYQLTQLHIPELPSV